MGKDPAFLFYPGDWLGGTMGMSFEEKGAYLELLVMQWHSGRITDANANRVVGKELWQSIKYKFESDEDGFFNERLEKEKEKRRLHSQKQKENAKKRWEKKTKTESCGGIAMAMPLENENENENRIENKKNVDKNFEKFWEAYPLKKGKGHAVKAWNKLKPGQDLTRAMIRAIGEQRSERESLQRAGKFVPEWKHPATWLNAEGWQDEVQRVEKQKTESDLWLEERTREAQNA